MKKTLVHRIVSCLKDYFEKLNVELEHNAKLKETLNLPSTMTSTEAMSFLWERYFGDECVIDTGPAIQAYPIMVERICKFIDNK